VPVPKITVAKFDMTAKRRKRHKNEFSLAVISIGDEIEIQEI
jgi:hypothetical protein